MKKYISLITILLITIQGIACTNLLVTKGASTDGSAYLVYTNDGEWLFNLRNTEAKDHLPGDSLTFTSRYGTKGKIAQAPHTNALIGFQMNEYQLAVGETTFTGREELWNKSKYLEYWHFMILALERSKTAREAVEVITSLAEEYGYGSEGESFSIVDPNEAWILEMVGTGTSGEGAVWVAVKIPDGYISAHANLSRIGEFPLDDPENCIYSENVISFAIEKGYYNPDSGEPFRFNHAYNPPSPDRLKYCESRVWSLFRRISPSLELSSDYHRGVPGTERYPLWIKPDNKISLEDVMDLIRDHYEETEIDMTKGLDAGPYGCPNRWRPLFWEQDSIKYSWERPISTYNTAFSYIGQMRNWLPDDIGGVCWFGVDDTYFSCYVPIYVGNTDVPEFFKVGDINTFSWKSAWWVFNFVSNFANLRYSYMIKDIQAVQSKLESQIIFEQDSVVSTALTMGDAERTTFLTQYSADKGTWVHDEWIALGEFLITKYNDGYIKGENNSIGETGYPEEWRNEMIRIYPDKFRIKEWNKEEGLKGDVPF